MEASSTKPRNWRAALSFSARSESRNLFKIKNNLHRASLIAAIIAFGSYTLILLTSTSHGATYQLAETQNGQTTFEMAYRESGGFFDDIRAADWRRLKERILNTPECSRNCGPEEAHFWYQNNWEPNFTCLHERRLGLWGDGGKWVCDPHRITASAGERGCIVYSVGSNNDFSFEEAVLRDISLDCEIHTFDHTIGSVPSNLPEQGNMAFHPWGLSRSDRGANMKSMATIVKALGHEGRTIDILKIDCEGCEWETVKSWFKGGIKIRQVLVEVHAGTKDVVPLPAMEFMSFMKQQGYVIFHKEPNIAWAGGDCIEYAFLRLDINLQNGEEGSST